MVLDADTQLLLTPQALRRARQRAGLSRGDVVQRSHISWPALQNYECPGHNPQYSYLLNLLEVYGLDLGGFHHILAEIHADIQRDEIERRMGEMTDRLNAVEAALGGVATGAEEAI